MRGNQCPQCFGDLPDGLPTRCKHCASEIHWSGGKAYRTRFEANNASTSKKLPSVAPTEAMSAHGVHENAGQTSLDSGDALHRQQMIEKKSGDCDSIGLGFFDRCLLFFVRIFRRKSNHEVIVDDFLRARRKIYFSWQNAKQLPAFLLWFVFATVVAIAVFFASILAPQFLQPHVATTINKVSVLTESVAKELARFNGAELDLSNVKTIDASAARELAKWRGPSLNLSGLKTLEQNAATQLAGWKGETLDLSGLSELPPSVAKILATWPGTLLSLAGVKTLSANTARELANCRAASIDLLGLASAGDQIIAILRVNRNISLPQRPKPNGGLGSTELPNQITNSIGIQLNRINPGTFRMGIPETVWIGKENMAREAIITKPFYLGVTEVTNAQWQSVMGSVPSKWRDPDRPVEQVSWEDVVSFCKKLSSKAEERAAGRAYRLPTEEEWEYACRAGSETTYSFGEDESLVGEFAWFIENAQGQTQPVGQKKPNQLGLHDMLGNVYEWCGDWVSGSAINPLDTFRDELSGAEQTFRGVCFIRGGCFNSTLSKLRWAAGPTRPSFRQRNVGLRLAMSPTGTAALAKPPATEWTDVIPLINPARDKVEYSNISGKNDWRVIDKKELRFVNDGKSGKIILPVRFSRFNLELEFEFTRTAGDANLHFDICPDANGSIPVMFDVAGRHKVRIGYPPVELLGKMEIKNNKRSKVLIRLSRENNRDVMQITFDQKVGGRVNDYTKLVNPVPNKKFSGKGVSIWVGNGTLGSDYIFHRIRFRMLGGATADLLK
jgi:formylglycine-generating enzyme required for sulfatase activity